MNITKRHFLWAGAAALCTIWLSRYFPKQAQEGTIATAQIISAGFELIKTEQEWREMLTPGQFQVLRQHRTELPGSSPLNQEHGKGTFVCAGCELPLFTSETKFESGTGWPSFYASIAGAIGTKTDTSFFMSRVEVHCHRCGGHLGHVFNDGPPPTGKRYCMNGVAMKFMAA